jgi:hypothetical protein
VCNRVLSSIAKTSDATGVRLLFLIQMHRPSVSIISALIRVRVLVRYHQLGIRILIVGIEKFRFR